MPEWIARCKGLNKKPEVLAIARAVSLDRRIVADLLCDFWDWADGETEDGFLTDVSLEDLPAIVPDTEPRFWRAVVVAGWLIVEPGGLRLPNFERWMGQSAKRRLRDTKRKRSVRNLSAKNRTTGQDRTLGEESPSTPLVVAPATTAVFTVSPAEFLEAWNAVRTFIHAKGLTGKRLRCFRARARDQDWVDKWPAAMRKP